MKTWTTLTAFAVSLMVIGFVETIPAHAGPAVIYEETKKHKACSKNLEAYLGYCPHITALEPLDDEPNAQSTAAEQNLKNSNNRNASIVPGNFSLARQARMETMLASQIDEAFTEIALLEPAVSPGGNFSLADKIGYFNFNNALGTNELFGMSEDFLFQFGADTKTMKTLKTEKR